MKLPVYLLLLTLATVNTFVCATEKPIHWATDSWKNYTNRDGSGLYHELMKQLFGASKNELVVNYVPWLRALELVKQGQADITGAMPYDPNYLMSHAQILTQPISVLMKKGSFEVGGASSLSERVGIWRSGYRNQLLNNEVKEYVSGSEVNDIDTAINLIRHNRADYLIDVRTMIDTYLATQKDAALFEVVDISQLYLYMAFTKSERGEQIKEIFDNQFAELKRTNVLQKLYAKYRVPLPE